MDFFNEEKYKYIFYILTLVLLISTLCVSIFKKNSCSCETVQTKNEIISEKQEVKENNSLPSIYHVDIKGAVNNPGVYELSEGSLINDAINAAGGIKKGGTTNNINLSSKIKDEMVIYIYTTTELNKLIYSCYKENVTDTKKEDTCESGSDITNCTGKSVVTSNEVKENTSDQTSNNSSKEECITNTGKVNINTASKEELLQVSGIGESKAESIIKYRETNKFNRIEDIKNVSGIGDSLYEKIKDYITV